jgi:hypothetical protein
MSRTGPAYVESESGLRQDIHRKQQDGEITERVGEAFLELYEFGTSVGDRVDIGEAKNANFQVKIDAHQSDDAHDPNVFTANVTGEVQIWPARRPLRNDPDRTSIEWDEMAYTEYKRRFRAISGVATDSTTVRFEALVTSGELDRFKNVVEEFVSACRTGASGAE